ncbi:MAG: LysM peptidoglycan-binding domain-containing protein [Methyloprofundus sp.]|nr:LysM peptidoglycan-binding domain-containing protein [Methyloprofundus sp.]MDT8426190.1 LysM peptidoglycan-binding domain-containing protein [Methyloprofundus sp.]
MASKAILGLILGLTLSLSSWADVIKLNPTHPTRHVVVKGDTLWDLSEKFLQDPWQWPNIWHHNGQIKNPHLIYPGDVITLCFIEGQAKLCVNSPTSDERMLYPHIRANDTDQAIAMIPIEAIAPFLTSPKVVSKHELADAPYIVDFSGEHIIAAEGDKIYVRSILKPEYLAYTTYRPGETYTDPENNEILGYEAEYIADNVILELGDPATLRITNTEKEVRRGDRLMPTSEQEVAFNFFPTPPADFVKGSIISVFNGVQEIGQYDVIVLSKGKQDGLKQGHLLSIIQKGKLVTDPFHKNKNELVKLPDQEAGIVLVFRTFERVSYGLVMHASKNIRVLDMVQTPEK